MELALPVVAMGGLYLISQQKNKPKKCEEGMVGYKDLPNTNTPNVNYNKQETDAMESPQLTMTEKLTHDNNYEGNAFTDKYYNPDGIKLGSNALNDHRGNVPAISNESNEVFTSLTGEKVQGDYFSHNNMVPFFGRKNTGRRTEGSNDSILDNYLGKGSQQYEKKEQAPLFSPNENTQWAYGTPNHSDFMQSRVNPVNKMSNVLPFEQETVGPGVGLGYGTEGFAGYNSGMLNREDWMPKTVDELRVKTNKKSSGVGLFGHEGPASSAVKEMGTIGKMEKNRTEKTFELGQDRLFTTTGLEKGATLRPIQEDRYTNRPETTVSYTGIASAENNGVLVDGEYMPSKHIDLGEVPITGAYAEGKGDPGESDYGIKSQMVFNNNRSANQQNDYFGAVGGAIGAVVSPLLDALRPSRKENTIGTLRPYQNPSTKVTQSYVFNPSDRPAPTIRETTERAKFHINTGNSTFNKGGYTVTNVKPILNNRMNQSDYFYAGNASGAEGTLEPRVYDAEYRQRNNDVKSSTIKGRMVPGNMSTFNNDIGKEQYRDKTKQLTTTRCPVPLVTKQSPGLDTMGRIQGKQKLYSGIQQDRSNKEILESLKKNPYALSIN